MRIFERRGDHLPTVTIDIPPFVTKPDRSQSFGKGKSGLVKTRRNLNLSMRIYEAPLSLLLHSCQPFPEISAVLKSRCDRHMASRANVTALVVIPDQEKFFRAALTSGVAN